MLLNWGPKSPCLCIMQCQAMSINTTLDDGTTTKSKCQRELPTKWTIKGNGPRNLRMPPPTKLTELLLALNQLIKWHIAPRTSYCQTPARQQLKCALCFPKVYFHSSWSQGLCFLHSVTWDHTGLTVMYNTYIFICNRNLKTMVIQLRLVHRSVWLPSGNA